MAFVILGVVAFIALIVVIFVLSAKAAQKRRDDLAAFAQAHRFQAYLSVPARWPSVSVGSGDVAGVQVMQMFQYFRPFGFGERPRAYNVVAGGTLDKTYYFFDYEYVTTETTTDSDGNMSTSTTTHTFGVAAVRVPLGLRQLEIRHEGFFDKIGGALGFKDIQFEMDEFNRKFHVKGPDPKFAYDVVNPGMIEFLMKAQARHWQLGENYVLVFKPGVYSVSELEPLMRDLDAFLSHIPDYLKHDISFRPTWAGTFE